MSLIGRAACSVTTCQLLRSGLRYTSASTGASRLRWRHPAKDTQRQFIVERKGDNRMYTFDGSFAVIQKGKANQSRAVRSSTRALTSALSASVIT